MEDYKDGMMGLAQVSEFVGFVLVLFLLFLHNIIISNNDISSLFPLHLLINGLVMTWKCM